MAEQFLNTNTFLEQIRKGSTPMTKDDTSIVVDDKSPSAVGGLAALGATALGTALIAKRIPGARNFFKTPKPSSNVTYTSNKTLSDSAGDNLTATGQSQELILSPSKSLVPLDTRSKFGEVQNIPFTQGKGYKDTNPLVGSATFDRIKEAQFDSAPAEQWIKWLGKANNPQLKVNSGPLTGVSRRVTADELDELNMIKLGKDGKPESGFLKIAMDEKIPVDRDTLLEMVNNSPINNLRTLRLGVRGNPTEEVIEITNDFKDVATKQGLQDNGNTSSILNSLRGMASRVDRQRKPLDASTINLVQNDLRELAAEAPDPAAFANILVKFNRTTGNYNQYSKSLNVPEGFRFRQDKRGIGDNFYPAYKVQTGYALKAGENYTEDVIYYGRKIPNVSGGKFSNSAGDPHFIDNEIGFIRYDDLPNPKLGGNKRHLRVSEIQTDIHSEQFQADPIRRANYFKDKINPFNTDVSVSILKKQRDDLMEKAAPFREIGRGIAGLTRKQEQELANINYRISQIEKSAAGKLLGREKIEQTTAAPLSRSWSDYVAKSLLRTMAERNINAISIVPSSMNKGVKMPGVEMGKLGDELNYGLMDGSSVTKTSSGAIKKTSSLASSVAPLKRIANQYGAKFEMFPMPKSNPNKRFKVVEEITTKDSKSYLRNIKEGRATYTYKDGENYVYQNHVGASNTLDEAEELLKISKADVNPDTLRIIEMGADEPRLYDTVPTLIADDQVLKKFLLPMKAYMYQGGFVDKTNIFSSLL